MNQSIRRRRYGNSASAVPGDKGGVGARAKQIGETLGPVRETLWLPPAWMIQARGAIDRQRVTRVLKRALAVDAASRHRLSFSWRAFCSDRRLDWGGAGHTLAVKGDAFAGLHTLLLWVPLA